MQKKAYKIKNTANVQQLHKTFSVQRAVSRPPLNAEAQVRTQASLRRNT